MDEGFGLVLRGITKAIEFGGIGIIAIGAVVATVTYLAANPPTGQTEEAMAAAVSAAQVDGFGVAFMWSAIIFGIAVVASLILINAGKDQVADISPTPGV